MKPKSIFPCFLIVTALEEVLEILVPVSQSLNAQTKGVAQMVTVPKGLVLVVFLGILRVFLNKYKDFAAVP